MGNFAAEPKDKGLINVAVKTKRDDVRQNWLDENGFELLHWGHPCDERWEYLLSSCRWCGTSIHTPCTIDVVEDLRAAATHVEWHSLCDDHWRNGSMRHTHAVIEEPNKKTVTGPPVIPPEPKKTYQPPGVYC